MVKPFILPLIIKKLPGTVTTVTSKKLRWTCYVAWDMEGRIVMGQVPLEGRQGFH